LGEGIFVAVVVLICCFASWGWAVLAASAFSLTGLLSILAKNVLYPGELRPLAYFKARHITIHTVEGVHAYLSNSFPSGHTITGFALFTVLALMAGPKPMLGLLCLLMALAVGFSRIYLAQHFFADVYFGSLIGLIPTVLLTLLFERTLAHRAWHSRSLMHLWKTPGLPQGK